jgi:HEAT repeat protein
VEYYQALVTRTNQLQLRSLRQVCASVIREGLNNRSVEVRVQATRALKQGVNVDTVPLVLEALRERKVPEEFIIGEPFLPVRTERLMPAVLKALGDRHSMVRVWAVYALAEIGGPEVVAPLSQGDGRPFFWVRAPAVRAVGRLKAPGTATTLLALLSDNDLAVRAAAAEALS